MRKRRIAGAGLLACLALALPAAGQRNGYGGYHIAGMPAATESVYGEARGWRVDAARIDGGFAYCVAERNPSDGVQVRLGWDGLQWQLAVPVETRTDWQGTLQIDGTGAGRGYRMGGDAISGTASGGWAIAWLGEAELDGLRQGTNAILGVGKFDYNFPLRGSTAAFLKVRECVDRFR